MEWRCYSAGVINSLAIPRLFPAYPLLSFALPLTNDPSGWREELLESYFVLYLLTTLSI
jgi:hypothetical protein